jgi:hypothetical protein
LESKLCDYGFPKQVEVEINYIAGKILEHQSVYLTNKQTNNCLQNTTHQAQD